MGATNNMVRGAIFSAIYIVVTLIIPFMTFTWMRNLGAVGGSDINITMSDERYFSVIFWISAFGLIISGCAFFTYSSPSQSIRRGVFALILVILNCLYLWSYKFSGATAIEFQLEVGKTDGVIIIDLQNMVLLYLGIYFLTIILKAYDLTDFIVNRKAITIKRYEKAMEKRGV